ncbi:hypothetical protein E3O45_01390 [Cryobacterium sp. TMS1-20-1]|uniref:hypothetical protein n=1 Tax=Cryobacterium sp. TMS1-20-1 TaxID=1259223 RepID=UPI00106B357E|nr:hypothetical protein [Cryobacterium sp. TMS1-20-1]TFC81021.1 hypothetical protein E3O45_01390 [Cryobacterium sp. TMS1-20-1]
MTLGEPQPLSRRQARELARHQEPVPVLDVPALTPAALRPAALAAPGSAPISRRSSRHHTPDRASEPAESAASTAPAETPTPPSAVPAVEHALSRRELRALQARQNQSAQEDAVPTVSAPVAREAAVPEAELIEAELIEPEQIEPEQIEPERSEPAGWTPPVGHWSVDSGKQTPVHAPEQSLDELINRGIGAGGIPTTTNALILPSIPHQGPSVSPISNTGEIIITGSFDLPRSLGSTGAHPNLFDSSEMDHMMDQLDADQLGGDSAPVSASRAVSTHASTRGMLTPPKKQRASLPMVLVITTAILAVSVLALFVTGYLLGIF